MATEGVHTLEGEGVREWHTRLLKEFDLSDFTGKFKPCIIIGKDVRAVFQGQLIQIQAAALGQHNGVGGPDGGQVFVAGQSTGAENIGVRFIARVK